ncbi:histone-lysine N-methyltransferase ATX2-like [Impatiens glandulifera]|uniref:histone-lysine N-methyltransferase ATX2-like n=1 Tax=Impatiens glandulifera TaxID=253017 RepID=UPI001FB0FE2E|nr:histone-lysine N-methyltransferase ATX2-like [Impatiens glandulifera]
MKGNIPELCDKREAREKRIIRIPQRYLPFSDHYSSSTSAAAAGKSSRSVPKKKKKKKDERSLSQEEQRLPQTGGGSDEFMAEANHEEAAAAAAAFPKVEAEKAAAVVQKMDMSTPTPNPPVPVKNWVRLMFKNNQYSDSNKLVGLQCKIYWPLDDAWYTARLKEYNTETGYHHVLYDDGDEEDVLLRRLKIQFLISEEELQQLRLSPYSSTIASDDLNQVQTTGHSFDHRQELKPGDVTWAKLAGHSAWPALVLEEELVAGCKGLRKGKKDGQKSYPVQFFGTHDLARVKITETTPFYTGFVSCLHHKCKKPTFVRGVGEAKLYLSEKKLPEEMLLMQSDTTDEDEVSEDASQEDDEEEVEEEEEEGGSVDSKDDEKKNVDEENEDDN